MSIEYRVTLAGNAAVEQVARRALPNQDERAVGDSSPLSADLYDRYGFLVTIYNGVNGYFDALSDQGSWEWQPKTYVSVAFDLDKSADIRWMTTNMLTVVRRVLDSGTEDAAFIFNGDILLLSRFDGMLVKHRRQSWWDHYPGANETLPG